MKTLITRLFLQTGLGVTFGYMFAAAYRTNDYTGMALMVTGVVVTFWAFYR
jgi:hypothetical protein